MQGDVKLVKAPLFASDNACVRFIQDTPFSSALVMSNIREATQGAHILRNGQPFVRELGGAMHVFALNGDLDHRCLREQLPLGFHRPVGDSDSEYAFCALLDRLTDLWLMTTGVLAFSEPMFIVSAFAEEVRGLGPATRPARPLQRREQPKYGGSLGRIYRQRAIRRPGRNRGSEVGGK